MPKQADLPGVPLVRALERGVALLRGFSATHPRRSLRELADTTGLDKSTARRLLHTLSVAGLVSYEPHSGLYSLGIGVLEIASAVDTGSELREIAAPYLSDLAERTGSTTFLWIEHEGMGLCVERARMALPLVDIVWFTVGTRSPLNCGAGPRVLLAWLPEAARSAALARDLPRRTPASQTDPALLLADAEVIRARGWELAVDDFVVGLSALGVPILTGDGRLLGALSLTALTEHVKLNTALFLEMLQQAAAEIGGKMIAPPAPVRPSPAEASLAQSSADESPSGQSFIIGAPGAAARPGRRLRS